MKVKDVDPVEKEREEKRKRFFKECERKATFHQRQMRRVQCKEEQERLKAMHEKKLMRERSEIRREAVREQRRLTKLQKEHQVGQPVAVSLALIIIIICVIIISCRKRWRSIVSCAAVRTRC